jgi:hypothetical protein
LYIAWWLEIYFFISFHFISFTELGTPELVFTELGTPELVFTELGTPELVFTELGTPELVFTELMLQIFLYLLDLLNLQFTVAGLYWSYLLI